MDIRDYLRMLRRGWPTVLSVTAAFVALAIAYLVLTPKVYESSTVLFVSANAPASIIDLQQGAQFAGNAVNTYAAVIDSPSVLGTVSEQLTPQRSVEELAAMVSTSVRTGTTLIDVVVAGDNPEDVVVIANAVASSSGQVIPALENPAGTPLVNVQQIRPAVEPTEPVSPNVSRMLALGLVVGLFIGLGATIAVQALDTRIRRVQDLRALTGVPVLGTLPSLKRGQRGGVAVRRDPAGPSGEAFRALRTNVRYLDARDHRSLVLTSVADNGDGAQVPSNLAWMLAESGQRVLLVDADLRRSSVAEAFEVHDGIGLADVLLGGIEPADAVRTTDHSRLDVLPSGTHDGSPSDLLSSPILVTTLRAMENRYDYVIVHAPPLLLYTDAAVVSSASGGTLVAVAAGRTRAQELTTALTVLTNVRVAPLGLILTHAGRSEVDQVGTGGTTTVRSRSGNRMLRRVEWDWKRDNAKKGS